MKGIILGAGVTGLAAGYATGFPIYEASNEPGGLCRSYYNEGYRFELGGGHWIFGSPHIISFIEKLSHVEKYERKAGIYINSIYPYPIQECLNKTEYPVSGSMREWFKGQFGNALCNIFFWPFNNKYTCGLDKYIIQDDPKKTPKDAKGYNDVFYYPAQGLNHFIDNLAKESNIHYEKEALFIDLKNKVVHFKNGEETRYDKLISTLPLERLLSLSGQYYEFFPYTSVIVCNIGGKPGPNTPKEHWLYIPGKEKFFRVGFYSNVEKTFAPEGKVSIYIETSCYPNTRMEASYPNEIFETLVRWGWVSDIEVYDFHHIDYAYTWVTKDTNRQACLDFLKDNDVISIGRYGRWKFQGIAESLEDGLGVVI